MNRPAWIIVHHTGGTNANPRADTSHHTFETVNEWHRQLWNWESTTGNYIGYHFFIDKTGKVTQGRGLDEAGAHTKGMNTSSIGICLAGNFDVTMPTVEQEIALRELLIKLMKQLKIPADKIVPHRKFSSKTCYGSNLKDDWAALLVKNKIDVCTLEMFSTQDLLGELRRRWWGT